MFKRITILLAFMGTMVFIAAAQQATPEPAPTGQHEIYTALAYGDSVFEPGIWLASAQEQSDRTTATWIADEYGAVGHVEYLHFDNGVPADLEGFFNNDWFTAVLQDYGNWRKLLTCHFDTVTLYLLKGSYNGKTYNIRYWTQLVNDTRVTTVFLGVPDDHADLMSRYAERLFPDAPDCQG
jgi:hypothetical protein